eukprot:4155615-Ditylum_brightwellii.AAC.1
MPTKTSTQAPTALPTLTPSKTPSVLLPFLTTTAIIINATFTTCLNTAQCRLDHCKTFIVCLIQLLKGSGLVQDKEFKWETTLVLTWDWVL